MKKIKIHRVMDSKRFREPRTLGAYYAPETSGCRVVISAGQRHCLQIESEKLAALRETMEDFA